MWRLFLLYKYDKGKLIDFNERLEIGWKWSYLQNFRCKCLAYLEIKEKNKVFIINKTKLEMYNKSTIKASYSFKKFLKLLLCFVYNTRANICSFVHLLFIVISQKKDGKINNQRRIRRRKKHTHK